MNYHRHIARGKHAEYSYEDDKYCNIKKKKEYGESLTSVAQWWSTDP